MKKIIINRCFGGFAFSEKAFKLINEKKGLTESDENYFRSAWDERLRFDPDAISVLEEYGADFCNGGCAKLLIEEFDDTMYDFRIDEYDGLESLELLPSIPEETIRACKSTDEIVDILKKVGVIREKTNEEDIRNGG